MSRLSRTCPAALMLLLVTALAGADAPKPPPMDGPLTPEKAPQSFQLEPGLRIELVAAEPLVVSPVALAFDERGRLYVAEDRGYPTGPGEGKPPVGRVALLEDTDGDGRMDRRSEFAEGLTYPNGVLPWKGGVIVTCAPDVFYLRDTDGDGKADEKRVLFTGFSTKGSTQLRVSHPVLSIDNWVYLTSGLTGGSVTSPDAPDRPPVVLGRTDFRFRPDGDSYEAADGGAQFGQTFDDFGRRFICYNRVQVQHVVIASKTLRRNPRLAFSETVQNCPADMVAEPLKGHGAAAKLFPISRNITTADSHAGTFTAACAVFVYRGMGLPDAYRGGAFSCDPTGNLVHFDRLDPDGVTFAARRARAGMEFLASTDNWFRPVFLTSGPDGALYVADMYRKTIEHPDYLPVEIRKRTDFESGKTMGRIWRVVREDASKFDASRLRTAFASPAVLCETLRERDGWWRDTVHRLLLEQHDPKAIEPLCALAADASAPAATVARALHLLDRFNALPDKLLRAALRHPEAPVRETALQLVEARLALPNQPDALSDVLPLADDSDARVRFQTAITIGTAPRNNRSSDVTNALARIAVRGASDRWLRAAVFSAANPSEAFLNALRQARRPGEELPPELLVELGRQLGSYPLRVHGQSDSEGIAAQALLAGPPIENAALITGFAEGRRKPATPSTGTANGTRSLLAELGAHDDTREPVRALIAALKATALNSGETLAHRSTAAGFFAFADYDETGPLLIQLLDPAQPSALQIAAVRALAAQHDERVTTALLDAQRFAAYTPGLRDEVLSALLGQSYHVLGVLKAVESKAVPASSIDALHRRQLSQHRDAGVKQRSEALFGTVAGDRGKVYDDYKSVASAQADPAHGRVVFRRECASCHRLDGEGFAVGPDLFGIRNQAKEAILLHVLVPDHEITTGFAAYTVATKDGRLLTGLVASESPTGITLRQPLGKEDTILRTDIDELAASKQSLMPQGLEKNITRQEFADLLGYLKGEAGRD